MTNLKLEILPGKARINTVVQIIDHPDVKIWVVDTHSKYHEVFPLYQSYGFRPGWEELGVILHTTEHTLRYNEDAENDTVLRIEVPADQSWELMTDGGRYTYRVCLYRYVEDPYA